MTGLASPSQFLLTTVSGENVDLLRIEDYSIPIEDIAHSLSRICRFAGHCSRFYSVAQHCINVADALHTLTDKPQVALAGLLHDAAEVFIGDIPLPAKRMMGRPVELLEERILAHVYKSHGVPFSAIPAAVATVDSLMLSTEAFNLYSEVPSWAVGSRISEAYPSTRSLHPEEAQEIFLRMYHTYLQEGPYEYEP